MEPEPDALIRVMAGDGYFVEAVPLEVFERKTVVISEWDLWNMLIGCGWPDASNRKHDRVTRAVSP